MHGRICEPIRTKLCKVTRGPSDGHRMVKCGTIPTVPPGVGVTISKRLWRKLQQWNYFVFYVIVKIILIPTYLPLDVYSNFDYFSSYSSLSVPRRGVYE